MMSIVIGLSSVMILILMNGLKLLVFAHPEVEWVWQLLENFCMLLAATTVVHH